MFRTVAPLVVGMVAGARVSLAVDANLHGQRVAAFVISVLYRGSAVPWRGISYRPIAKARGGARWGACCASDGQPFLRRGRSSC